jgi:hypothetical protein
MLEQEEATGTYMMRGNHKTSKWANEADTTKRRRSSFQSYIVGFGVLELIQLYRHMDSSCVHLDYVDDALGPHYFLHQASQGSLPTVLPSFLFPSYSYKHYLG